MCTNLFRVVLVLIVSIPLSAAPPLLQKKIDSLFVIASSGEVRFREASAAAVDSLAQLGTDAVVPLVDKLNTKSARERVTIINILKKIGSPAVPILTDALGRTDGLIVERVCNALGEIGDSSASAGLQAIARHPRWQVRDEAMAALGKIKASDASNTLGSGLVDSIGHVRKSAAISAGKVKGNSLIPQLVQLLDDPFYGARLNAASSLRQLDTALVVESLGAATLQLSMAGGNLACDLLGELGTREAIIYLSLEGESSNPERRSRAARALLLADSVGTRSRVDSITAGLPLDSLFIRQMHSRTVR